MKERWLALIARLSASLKAHEQVRDFIFVIKLLFVKLFGLLRAHWLIIFFPALIVLFIYWLLSPRQREWIKDYLIPVIFFLALAGRTTWRVIKFIYAWAGKRSVLFMLTVNNLLVLSFMAITITSYIIRSRPIQKAIGFKERFFPVFVVLFHLVGSYIIAARTKFQFNLILYILGIIFSIVGITLDCLALWQLKRSFSIMVEVRKLVTGGVYSFIRHPLYAGELLHFLGMALLFNNISAYGMFLFLFLFQGTRAILEEKKISMYIPEYADYRKRAGFFLPKFWQLKSRGIGRASP